MIDRKWIGHELPASELTLDRTRLRFFAKAIGETDPVYTELTAAREAGHADLPAPPTFLFAAELDSGAIDTLLALLEIPLAQVLHGEQSFTYHRCAYAGETLTFSAELIDIYEKKNGALQFLVQRNFVTDQQGLPVAEFDRTIVIRWA